MIASGIPSFAVVGEISNTSVLTGTATVRVRVVQLVMETVAVTVVAACGLTRFIAADVAANGPATPENVPDDGLPVAPSNVAPAVAVVE